MRPDGAPGPICRNASRSSGPSPTGFSVIAGVTAGGACAARAPARATSMSIVSGNRFFSMSVTSLQRDSVSVTA